MILYSLNIYQLDCSVYVFHSRIAQMRMLNPIPFAHQENHEINEKKLKKATVGISREIWWSSRETGRFYEKLGDSRENRSVKFFP